MAERQQYAAWKAADIRKALREGRVPQAGPPVNDDDLGLPEIPGWYRPQRGGGGKGTCVWHWHCTMGSGQEGVLGESNVEVRGDWRLEAFRGCFGEMHWEKSGCVMAFIARCFA